MREPRVLVAPGVDRERVHAWRRAAPEWFGAGRRDVPGAEGRAHLALVETELGELVVKRDRPDAPPWRRALSRTRLREARAPRAFVLGHALLDHGLSTPEPLAAWVEQDGTSVLVTRRALGRSPWAHVAAASDARAALLELAELVGRSVAALHGAGFRHRDLKAPNLLIAEEEGARHALWLDLDGLRLVPAPDERTVLRDLARLCASLRSREARAAGVRAGDWEPFLAAYLRAAGRPPTALPDALARTRRWADRHVERNLVRARPVE